MEPADYYPPEAFPYESRFSLWAHKLIIELDLHPDESMPPGSSEAEIILLNLWNGDPPPEAINPQIDKVIFRAPSNSWHGTCSTCLKLGTLSRKNPFYCQNCVDELIKLSRRIAAKKLHQEHQKAQEHKKSKEAAKERRKVRKAAERLMAPHQSKEALVQIHPLLVEDPFYFEDDPYIINKNKSNHMAAIEMVDN